MSEEETKKQQGLKILEAFKKQLVNYRINEKHNPNGDDLENLLNENHGVNLRNGFKKFSKITSQ